MSTPNGDSVHALMSQQAAYPDALADLVLKLDYRPGWHVSLAHEDRGQGSVGLTLTILAAVDDSYTSMPTRICHLFIVPAAAYDRDSWQRWLLDRFIDVETHEACEYFTVEGDKPYAPHHGPGRDPYVIHDLGTDEQRRTSYRGEVKPS